MYMRGSISEVYRGMVYMYRGQPGGLGLRQAAYHDIKHPTLKAGWSPCTKKVTEIVTIYVSLFFLEDYLEIKD